MMRTEEVVSASIWLAKVGRLTSTAKIKSDTAIERIVRIFLRLLRSRFLKIRVRYFVIFPCSGYAEIWSEEVAFVDAPPFSAPMITPFSKLLRLTSHPTEPDPCCTSTHVLSKHSSVAASR